MSEQYESLNERTRLIEISLKYTDGDMEKAKAMASGQYLDTVVVKSKFFMQKAGRSGMFLAFFNIRDEYISFVETVVVSNASIYDKSRIFDDWKILFGDINAFRQGNDVVEIAGLNDRIIDEMVSRDIFPDVQGGNLDDLTKSSVLILRQVFGDQQVQCQVEIEPTSSLMMELGGVPLATPQTSEPAPKEKQKEDIPETEFERRIRQIEEEANYVVDGASIVAPVKGKYINEIKVGEKIMVLLPNKDPVSRKVLNVLEAVDSDGRISPIKGRIKDKVPMEKGGVIIYALVAKGVLAKLVEEENVKIRMEDTEIDSGDPKSENRILILMASLLFLIIIGSIILFIYM